MPDWYDSAEMFKEVIQDESTDRINKRNGPIKATDTSQQSTGGGGRGSNDDSGHVSTGGEAPRPGNREAPELTFSRNSSANKTLSDPTGSALWNRAILNKIKASLTLYDTAEALDEFLRQDRDEAVDRKAKEDADKTGQQPSDNNNSQHGTSNEPVSEGDSGGGLSKDNGIDYIDYVSFIPSLT
jgi:hypothetical protein